MSWLNPVKETKKEEVEEKKEKFDLFKVMYSCLKKDYKPTEDEKKKLNEWLFLNVLSNNKSLIEMTNEFNIREIPVEVMYDIVNNLVPKMYIPYPKKTKIDKDIEATMDRYNISKSVAQEYLKILKNN